MAVTTTTTIHRATTTPPTTTPPTTRTTTTLPVPPPSNVGDKITYSGGASLQVYSYDQPVDSADGFSSPVAGSEFGVVDIEVCAGSSAVSYNGLAVAAKGKDNRRYQPAFSEARKPDLRAGDLPAGGGCIRGFVTLEVPAGQRPASIMRDYPGWQMATWNVGGVAPTPGSPEPVGTCPSSATSRIAALGHGSGPYSLLRSFAYTDAVVSICSDASGDLYYYAKRRDSGDELALTATREGSAYVATNAANDGSFRYEADSSSLRIYQDAVLINTSPST